MAVDEAFAARIRACLDDEPDVVEKKMFGGVGFLLHGNMTVGIWSHGNLMIRVPPGCDDPLLETPGVSNMHMGAKEMKGWLNIPKEDVADDDSLRAWVRLGIECADGMPPK